MNNEATIKSNVTQIRNPHLCTHAPNWAEKSEAYNSIECTHFLMDFCFDHYLSPQFNGAVYIVLSATHFNDSYTRSHIWMCINRHKQIISCSRSIAWKRKNPHAINSKPHEQRGTTPFTNQHFYIEIFMFAYQAASRIRRLYVEGFQPTNSFT